MPLGPNLSAKPIAARKPPPAPGVNPIACSSNSPNPNPTQERRSAESPVPLHHHAPSDAQTHYPYPMHNTPPTVLKAWDQLMEQFQFHNQAVPLQQPCLI
ncbi:hypothetical protein M378DRAFT_12560 [Amanita muscaria Koide BX008]|uniref:Uncharacterized protein n=1 Tax=Amanita muscaria (strain Koide BX008) TaxID=946122 RepID=A0A0C2T8I4_AMAMK|nr:hypothetical protein M378DRAFT_12560 [Amanita muscaria Koide BX008]